MESLRGKKIILGVCASIAAYKAAILLRLLTKAGAEVQVVMTPDAVEFITPLTLSTLSGRPVLVSYFERETGEWNNHVHLALWADALLIAPATANTLSKFAQGACDNLLTAIYLSARSPVFLAPAMDLDMWKHGSTQGNVERLRSFGNIFISPEYGELASGLVGEGRLAEPEEIVTFLQEYFEPSVEAHGGEGWISEDGTAEELPLSGKKALVSAGPTQEAIDPVRYISNHSSGKMGFALAVALAKKGAEVTLVHGPASASLPIHTRIKAVPVLSAEDMLHACLEAGAKADLIVMAAAVADYTPMEVAKEKIKKTDGVDDSVIRLKKTTDILAELGRRKTADQVLVGFALETQNEEENALSKLKRKNLDLIVLNSLRDEGAGFGTDTNQVTLYDRSGQKTAIPLKSKQEMAEDIIQYLRTTFVL